MIYTIEPIDTFFFRSSVPFEAGGVTTMTKGIFPPLPSVYSGALKVFKNDRKEDGQNHVHKLKYKVKFNGLFLKDNTDDEGSFLFPLPRDLYPYENSYKIMHLSSVTQSSYPLSYMLVRPSDDEFKKDKQEKKEYLKLNDLKNYLNLNNASYTPVNILNYYKAEAKVGIAMDENTGIAKDKMIYETLQIRMCDQLKLVVEASDIEVTNDVIPFGGEGRRGKIKVFNKELELPIEEKSEVTDSYFKLYLATPAIYKNGWLPAWIDPTTFCGSFSYKKKRVKLKLISACVGKPISCGGYSGEMKPLRYAVPEGSVYYFRIVEGDFELAKKLFHMKCISDYRVGLGDGFNFQEYRNRYVYCDRGFGYALVGKLTEEQIKTIKGE